ncbi:ABC transporter substrate-binding protein [Sphingopyxis sp. MWB1]|uniref:ABC transporter substrate-binding protein n=1 Tax=Sphingopyxis sp. MWB1 TaxID=1537715 RepID=UPI0006910534|nr:ABC transporter substrate-binding protein [Sphingopyxis sp. MWB1]
MADAIIRGRPAPDRAARRFANLKRRLRALAMLGPMALLPACQPAAALADRQEGDKPRVVSIDYCADQMAIGLLPRARIAAISHEADSDVSFSAPRAQGIARLRPALEDIIALQPDMVVRSYGGDGRLAGQLEKLGIQVVQLGYAGDMAGVRADMLRVGRELGAEPRAHALVARFDANLAAAEAAAAKRNDRQAPRPHALYLTPGDVTTGPGSLVAEVIESAGFTPYRQRPGWGSIPLEELVRRPPDMVFRAFFDSSRYAQDRWTSSRHPVLGRVTAGVPDVEVPGGWLACGNWLAGDAVARLAAAQAAMKGGAI